MHVDGEHLILWYLSIRRSNLGIRHIVTIVKVSRSFSWYAVNDLMYLIQLWFLGIWNGHFSHLPKLNYGCKIECLQLRGTNLGEQAERRSEQKAQKQVLLLPLRPWAQHFQVLWSQTTNWSPHQTRKFTTIR